MCLIKPGEFIHCHDVAQDREPNVTISVTQVSRRRERETMDIYEAEHLALISSGELISVMERQCRGRGAAIARPMVRTRMLTPLIDGLGRATWSSTMPVTRSRTPSF